MNAIIHRDYSNPASSLINLYTDRVEFISFGGLMPGITLEDIQLGLSVCRNKRLADLFYQLKLVESYGTGLARIKSAYKGSRLAPQILAAPSSFKVVLPHYQAAVKAAPKPVKKAAGPAPSPAPKPKARATGNEETVLAFGKEYGEFIRSDIEELLGVSPATATRLLRQMENSGLVLKRGKAKAIRYRISENS
jgi:predicted HTH transcriptional regulator